MSKKFTLLLIATLGSMIFLSSCASTTIETNDEWRAELYFKRAQDAANRDNQRLALNYYEFILNHFADYADVVAVANYEAAVLHFRMRHYQQASDQMALVEEAIKKGVAVPDWLPILTVMMRGNIDAKVNEATIKREAREAKQAEKEARNLQRQRQREARELTRQATPTSPQETPKDEPAPPAVKEPEPVREPEPDPEGWGSPDEWLD